MSKNSRRNTFIIFATALIALVVLSLLPWGSYTGYFFKDFSLLSDLFPESDQTYITEEIIDPELAAMQNQPAKPDTIGQTAMAKALASNPLPADFKAPEKDGVVLIEDYSGGPQMNFLKTALRENKDRRVRIAVVGDSYIEGDIFTQDVRSLLQDTYGGSGVGYMAAFSEFPGFRQSVAQSGSGWTEHDIRKASSNDLRILPGRYFTGASGANAKFKGTSKPSHTDSWTRSEMMFVAPTSGTITLSLSDNRSETFNVTGSEKVQSLSFDGKTDEFSFKSSINGLKVLGVWLTADNGIVLDCMSLRGNSGISHRTLTDDVVRQMREYVDFDLIILEFGINALSSNQSDYSQYASAMTQVVRNIQRLYPKTAIMMMGIGDRGQKQGATTGSMKTASDMVRAQRDVARQTGVLFWDTRAAMGGEGAVVDWHDRKLINADYIHLNHKGGRELAELFVKSINLSTK